jgi:putative ABC transport system ATP-binding protein
MIELLGIGMPAPQGRWLFRRVSARVETAELITVVSPEREARLGFLDAISARRIPTEGRVWVNGHALTRDTQARFHSRVREVDLHADLVPHRSLLWNVQVGGAGALRFLDRWRRRSRGAQRSAARALTSVGLERLSNERVSALDSSVQRRGRIAQAFVSQPDVLIVRELEQHLSLSDAADVLAALRVLVSCDRVTVVVSTAEPILVQIAQRVLTIVDGALRFNGPPSTSMTGMSTPAKLVAAG